MSDDTEITNDQADAGAGGTEVTEGASAKTGDGDQPKWSNLPTVSFRKLQRKTLGQILVESKALSESQLDEALEVQQEESGKLGEILVEKELVSEEDMLRALAYQLDLPYYARLPVNDIDPSLVDNIPIQFCRDNKILTGCITCNTGSPLAAQADFPIEVVVGPEFVTGSTRMKSGTAQKLVLNMISTSVMIKLGRVVGNTMVDMQLSNNKLLDRGTKIVARELKISYNEARELLTEKGSVRDALAASVKE